MTRTTVRVLPLTAQAANELIDYGLQVGAGTPYRQGTSPELLWDFTNPSQLSDAQLFAVNARNTPGARVTAEPFTRPY